MPSTDLIASKPRFLLAGADLTLLANPASDPKQLEDAHWVEEAVAPYDEWYFPGLFVANPLDSLHLVRLIRTVAFRFSHGDPDGEGVASRYQSQGEAFQVAGRVLIAFAREVRDGGATPVVVVFSPAREIEVELRGEARPYVPLIDWLARAGIPTVDVTDDLVDEARRSGLGSVVQYHYRPLGNEVVARALARRLPPLVSGTCGDPGGTGR